MKVSGSGELAQALPGLRPRAALWRRWVRFVRRNPVGTAAGFVCVLAFVVALFPGPFAPYNPNEIHATDRFRPPGTQYWMGTDNIGRDLLSRIIYGTRSAMIVGVGTVVLALAIGAVVGVAAGYWGGTLDVVLSRIVDAFLTLPPLLIALALVSILEPGLQSAIVAIALSFWPVGARVIRADVMAVKERVFVEAARAIGASDLRIILRHILPNAFASILVLATLWVGNGILVEAILSFLGLGTQPPTPDWGAMLSLEGREYFEQAWWLALWPGVAISIVVIAFNLAGDTIRDVADPRMRGIS